MRSISDRSLIYFAFVLGENPANWTTGSAPPSPASEFIVDTLASVIIPPDSVPMAPNHKGNKRIYRNFLRLGRWRVLLR